MLSYCILVNNPSQSLWLDVLQKTMEEWRTVLFVSAGVSVLGILVYGLFANSELAPWANESNLELEVDSEGKIKVVDEPTKTWRECLWCMFYIRPGIFYAWFFNFVLFDILVKTVLPSSSAREFGN